MKKFKIFFNTFSTIFDRKDFTLDDISSFVKNPLILNSDDFENLKELKKSLPLFYFGTPRNPKSDRILGNRGICSALVLDIDGDISIKDFISKYQNKFKFFLYTTISNTCEINRFRVIIPTELEFYFNKYQKMAVQRYFENICDPAGFSNSFFVPCKINDSYFSFESTCEALLSVGRFYSEACKIKFAEFSKNLNSRLEKSLFQKSKRFQKSSSWVQREIDYIQNLDFSDSNDGKRRFLISKISGALKNALSSGIIENYFEVLDFVELPEKYENLLVWYLNH